MSRELRRIEPEIIRELESCGMPFSVEAGGRHLKIRIEGRLVGILSRNGHNGTNRVVRNTIARIRRTVKELKHGVF